MAVRCPPLSRHVLVLGLLASGALGACGSDAVEGTGATAGTASSASGSAGSSTAGSSAQSGTGGPSVHGGAPGGGSSAGGSNGGASAGMAAGGNPADAPNGGAGAAGAGIAGGGAAGSANGGSAGGPPSNCNLPTPVSFQKNIQGFLATSCGKAVSGGCHVTDSAKTSLGYDHAYDWITAVAHTGSCGKTPPYAKRFEVVLDVIRGAKPASCPNSRQMPPAGMGTALTACQIAALQAWLAEPLVSQMHVPETDDTKDLYPPGPYSMPPFN